MMSENCLEKQKKSVKQFTDASFSSSIKLVVPIEIIEAMVIYFTQDLVTEVLYDIK